MTNAEYTAKKLDIYNQQIAICRKYGLTGLLQYTEKPPQHTMPPQAKPPQDKPKRKPKRNLKPHQKFILVLCRLIVK